MLLVANLLAGEVDCSGVGQSMPLDRARRGSAGPAHCVEGGGGSGTVHTMSALRADSLAPPSHASKWPAPSTSIMVFGSRAAA